MRGSGKRLWIGLSVALLTLTVFAPVVDFDFVNYDDLEFVVENPRVSTGISAANARWAVANAYAGTGGPLTWISHMMDAQLFGLDAGAHHRTSLLLHTCNVLLLFAVLWTMTRATGRSALVAALFAVHPLHVESLADRFTYVPLVGLFIVAAWGGALLLERAGLSSATQTIAAFMITLACAVVARTQVLYWQNGVALWEHAVRVTPDSARAHANLGVALARAGQNVRSIDEYRAALRYEPDYAEAHNNLGLALAAQGALREALSHYAAAVTAKPDYVNAHMNLANALDESGRADEAIGHYREAIRLDSTHVLARINLAAALARAGKLDEAIVELEAALRLDPGNAAARKLLEEMKRARG